MNRTPIRARRAAALLLAAAALPFTPALAQEAQTPPSDPPVAETPAEPAPQPEAETTTPEPVTTEPVAETAADPAPVRRTERTAPRTTAVRRPAPAPAATLAAPVPALPPASALPPAGTEVLPDPGAGLAAAAPEELPVQPPVTTTLTQEEPRGAPVWPWLLVGLLALGALGFLLMRRRRRADAVYHEESREAEPAFVEPVGEAPVTPAVVAAAPVAAAAAVDAGRPEIELSMRPRRAGVDGSDARVEFELTVGNSGTAPARDLRVSTWMLAADASEAERALIEPRDHADTPPVTIDAGEARTMEGSVALATSEVTGDSVLPVVVADARYVLPDGSEEHRAVSFAVGVPVEGELAHFDTENPSGLHEDVEARPFGGNPGR
jgi:Meckel syndrome type 1 protein